MGIFQQKYIKEAEPIQSSEHDLWTAVLSKAAHDAIYSSDWREAKKAISWFKSNRKDFKEVCQLANRDPAYVYRHMLDPIAKREAHMKMIRNGGRYYVKETEPPPKQHHSHYRGTGPKIKSKHLMGNSYYKAKREKNLKMVLRGSKGGRPKLYGI
jgi:hypothetical protein|tara:strand:- start:117 stop:581 length:465 start_codon:yes stop_codon:yes gene_type:complete